MVNGDVVELEHEPKPFTKLLKKSLTDEDQRLIDLLTQGAAHPVYRARLKREEAERKRREMDGGEEGVEGVGKSVRFDEREEKMRKALNVEKRLEKSGFF